MQQVGAHVRAPHHHHHQGLRLSWTYQPSLGVSLNEPEKHVCKFKPYICILDE